MVMAVVSCDRGWHPEPFPEKPGKESKEDDGTGRSYEITPDGVTNEVICNYLDRAVTMQQFLHVKLTADPGFEGTEDDERMILNIGAKYIVRSLCTWGNEKLFTKNYSFWLDKARERAERIWARDPDVVFQCAMFECVTPTANMVPIPDWVFEAFGLPVETRNFDYEKMKYPDGRMANQWGTNRIVPDITRQESQLWFYHMAVKYMDAGCEAISMEQTHLMGQTDKDWQTYDKLLKMIREAAKTHARRGYVIINTIMITPDGRSLGDHLGYPFRFKEVEGSTSYEAQIVPKYIDSIVGKKYSATMPSGYYCEDIPYELDFDNFGSSDHPGKAGNDIFCWGWDEISWFSNLSSDYQKKFLRYAHNYMAENYPYGFVSFPLCRNAVDGPVNPFKGNTQSAACPTGQGIEETVKEIWASE